MHTPLEHLCLLFNRSLIKAVQRLLHLLALVFAIFQKLSHMNPHLSYPQKPSKTVISESRTEWMSLVAQKAN